MGHCVGGYCDDVASGRTQIYSLRDKKGQPHVTIEVEPPMYTRMETLGNLSDQEKMDLMGKINSTGDRELIKRYGGDTGVWFRRDGTFRMMPDPKLLDEDTILTASTPKIKQIKGKANARPNDEYLPFVQDFVRSGKWSDVGDLGNSGLYHKRHLAEAAQAPEEWGDYLTMDQIKQLREGKAWKPIDTDPELDINVDFAEGGLVNGNLTPAHLDAIMLALDRG